MRREDARRLGERGSAAVEFALCLPIMLAMTFGVVEASNAVFLQQALTSAAYEAANVASAVGGTSTNAQTRANAVLTSLGVKSATVTISPTVTASTVVGTTIVVTCSAPLSANSIVLGYVGQTTLTAKITIPHM
mgnify:CR=1 FL=1